MEEFLEKLRAILSANHYEDVEDTVAYYREMIMDKKENGENEAQILEELGSVERVASMILGKTVKEDDLTNNEMQYIEVNVKSIDCIVEASEVSEMVIDAPNEELIEIITDGNTLRVSQINSMKFQLFSKPLQVYIQIPKKRKMRGIRMKGISSDFQVEGDLDCDEITLSTVSGDNKLKKVQVSNLNITSTSGDCKLKDCSMNECYLKTVSGDIRTRHVSGYIMRSTSVSGDIKMKEIDFEKSFLKTTSGDIDAVVQGPESEYTVYKNKGNRGFGRKILELKTVSGDIDYSFI